MTVPLLKIKGLTINIGPARVVDGIYLSVMQGESRGILGESGCDKSLTLLSLVRLLSTASRPPAAQSLSPATTCQSIKTALRKPPLWRGPRSC